MNDVPRSQYCGIQRRPPDSRDPRKPQSVITSYSIHYTKLYELRALTVNQFLCGIEPFTANTILAAVGAKVDISLVVNLLEDIAHYSFVKLISGADEVVVVV